MVEPAFDKRSKGIAQRPGRSGDFRLLMGGREVFTASRTSEPGFAPSQDGDTLTGASDNTDAFDQLSRGNCTEMGQ